MKKKVLIVFIIFALLLIVFGVIKMKTKYKYIPYTKEQVMKIYRENTDLFEKVVQVISSNNEFYDAMHVWDYDDAFLDDPNPKKLKYFNDEDRSVLIEFFKFGPSRITFDDSRCFVKFIFVSGDRNGFYAFLYWLGDMENEEKAAVFTDYKKYLTGSYHYVVEDISDNWIFYYDQEK